MTNSTDSGSNMDSKKWNEDVLITGGTTYYYPTKSDNAELKGKYRVSMTYKREHTKKLKYKVKVSIRGRGVGR